MKKELNKKFFSNFRVWPRCCLTLFCISLTSLLLTASSAIGQQKAQKLISLKLDNVTVLQALEEINKLSQNNVIFKKEEVARETKKVSVNLKEVTVLQAVGECIKGTKLICAERNGKVAVGPDTGAKSLRIAGTVTDVRGDVLPGVTVIVKGLTVGTATDKDGKYSLALPKMDHIVLLFSFVGMETREVKYIGKETINVVMQESEQEMDEVVITGYQKIDRRHLTSAVHTVKMEDIYVPGTNRIDQMLEGRIPGLTFMQNTGQVGAAPKLRIRGSSTVLGSQEPLWVVDGVIQQDPVNVDPARLNDLDFVNLLGNAISGLNPNDIERIDVLKDASATALYGVRAANGVIVITTKIGKIGAPTVNYTMSGTFTQRPRYSDRGFYMMNSKERVEISRELMEKGVRYSGVYDGVSDWIGYERAYLDYFMEGTTSFDDFKRDAQWYETMNTDWLGLLTEDVFSNNHSVSISGGTQNIRYYASFGYADERGNVKGEESKRYTSTLKLTSNYKRLSTQFGFTGSVTNKKYNPSEVNVMSYALSMNRSIPLYDKGGELWYYPKKADKQPYQFNIVADMENTNKTIDQYSASLNGQLQYKFTDDFRVMVTMAYQFGATDEDNWFGEDAEYTNKLKSVSNFDNLCPFGGVMKTSNVMNNSYTLRLQADYNKPFGKDRKHLASLMAGYELSSTKYNTTNDGQRGYYKDRGNTFANMSVVGPEDLKEYFHYYKWLANNHPTYDKQLTNLMSGYLTLTYAYDNRYILNFNTRADWSNAFGSQSREKFFPIYSLSGRWNMSSDILQNVAWIENMALRLSYGLQGNILNNQPNRLIINKGSYDDALDGFTSTIKTYPNPGLKWEKTHSYNVGLDFSFLKGNINGSFGVYYKKTVDAFLPKRVASQNGITSYTVNAGNVENKGVELSLNFTPINRAYGSNGKRGFVWRIDPQIGQTLNQLINREINKNNNVLQDEITVNDLLSGNAYMAGTPLNTFYSYRYNGLDNKGVPTFKGLEDEQKKELAEKYDEMALLDKKDVWLELLEESGTRVPVIQGNISNYMAYRNFSLSFNLAYSIGNKIRMFKLCSGSYSAITPTPHSNLRKEFANRWRFPGDEKHTDIPGIRANFGSPTGDALMDYGWWRNYSAWRPTESVNVSKYDMYDDSDLRVARGDYLRLQSLTFRYIFNKELIRKAGMSNADISFTATNLFTLCDKKLKGQNPEQSGISNQINISVRPTYTISLNVNF